MAALITTVQLPDGQEVDRAQAAVLLEIKPSRVGTLVRDGKLSEPMSIGQLREYHAGKGEGVGKKAPDGTRRYEVRMSPAEAADMLKNGYDVVDPRERTKAREAAALAKAEAELAEAGVDLGIIDED